MSENPRPFSAFQGRLLIGAVGVAILGGLVVLTIAMLRDIGQDPLGETEPSIERAVRFTLPRLNGDGAPFSIEEHAGGPVFIYFWASWCAPCRREATLIEALWPEFEAKGYTFVGVNILDSEDSARAFIAEYELSFPMLRDANGQVYLDFGVSGVPEGYFLSPGLEVESRFVGELREDDFRELLGRIGDAS